MPHTSHQPHSRLVNLTSHPVRVLNQDGDLITTIPAGTELRAEKRLEPAPDLHFTHDGDPTVYTAPVTRKSYEMLSPIPEPRDGVLYIVSKIALDAILEQQPHRRDFVAPGELTFREIKRGKRTLRVAHASVGFGVPYALPSPALKEQQREEPQPTLRYLATPTGGAYVLE